MNIVFDLGGVVFSWRPDAIIKSVFDDLRTQEVVRKRIFDHPDWVKLDKGTISLEQAIDRGAKRTALPACDIERLFHAVPWSLTPIEQTIELICQLRNTNNKLFVLSNMHLASIAHLEEQHKIWEMFEGIVISSRIQKVKPEIQIYEHLLNLYGLKPAETIFIDDTQENLAAAASIGIHTIRFTDADQCKRDLVSFRCL